MQYKGRYIKTVFHLIVISSLIKFCLIRLILCLEKVMDSLNERNILSERLQKSSRAVTQEDKRMNKECNWEHTQEYVF